MYAPLTHSISFWQNKENVVVHPIVGTVRLLCVHAVY